MVPQNCTMSRKDSGNETFHTLSGVGQREIE